MRAVAFSGNKGKWIQIVAVRLRTPSFHFEKNISENLPMVDKEPFGWSASSIVQKSLIAEEQQMRFGAVACEVVLDSCFSSRNSNERPSLRSFPDTVDRNIVVVG